MLRPTLFRQRHLFLPLTEPRLALFGMLVNTLMARHAFFKFRTIKIFRGQWHPAGRLQVQLSLPG